MRGRDEANAAVLSLLVGFLVVSVSFVALLGSVVQQGGGSQKSLPTDPNAVVASLADRLFVSTGVGWYPSQCTAAPLTAADLEPEYVTQFGLAEECSGGQATNNISFAKLEQMSKANLTSDPTNGAVDYADARRSLGLGLSGLDFHLRSWPLLVEVQERLDGGQRDPNLRPVYIGDYENPDADVEAPVPDVQAGALDGPSAVTLYVDVLNNGITETAFSVIFKVPTRTEIVTEKHSAAVPPGLRANLTFVVNKTADWEWKRPDEARFEYVVRDPQDTVAQGQVAVPYAMTGTGSGVFLVEAARLQWTQADPQRVDVAYDVLRGTGRSDLTYPGWSLRFVPPAGSPFTVADLAPGGGTAYVTLPPGSGAYTVELLAPNGFVLQSDRFNIVTDALGPLTLVANPDWAPQTPVPIEAAYLAALVEAFDVAVPDAHFADPGIPFAPEGDVFPDDNQFLADALPRALTSGGAATTANYNVVVVGSNVDHNTLTSGAVKLTIRDWVLAGGALVVLGSDEQSVQWMQPLYHVGIDTGNGGIGVPDLDHPILTTPNDLDVDAYTSHDTVWRFHREEDKRKFTHVINQGPDQVLTVSDPGAFGQGRVLLTSFRAYDLLPAAGPDCTPAAVSEACPGLLVLDNFLSTAYRGIYVDFGPPIPEDGLVAAQSRIAAVYHPDLRRTVEVQFLVYVFG